MRILIHSINFSPELTGVGKYTGEMSQWLSRRGHDVRVVTAPPYYPAWKVDQNYSSIKYQSEFIGKVYIFRCPLYIPSRPSALKRIIHLASFSLASLPVMLRQIFWRPDIVITIEPPLFCAVTSWLVARLSGAKCQLHIQDFEVDAAFDLGILNNKYLRKAVQCFERVLLKRYDVVSTISMKMLEKLIDKGVPESKQLYFPNWVDCNQIYPIIRSSVFKNKLGISDDSVIALYSGNMGEKQGLELIIESARLLVSEPGIRFVMCGEGSAYEILRTMASGLQNITWLPLQPLERLNELLNMADIHLLPQRAGAADLVMPSKLTGMLASGRPIVTTAAADTQVAAVVENRGIVVEPENSLAFTDAVRKLVTDSKLRSELGCNARDYAEKYLSYDSIMSRFEQELVTVVGSARS